MEIPGSSPTGVTKILKTNNYVVFNHYVYCNDCGTFTYVRTS